MAHQADTDIAAQSPQGSRSAASERMRAHRESAKLAFAV